MIFCARDELQIIYVHSTGKMWIKLCILENIKVLPLLKLNCYKYVYFFQFVLNLIYEIWSEFCFNRGYFSDCFPVHSKTQSMYHELFCPIIIITVTTFSTKYTKQRRNLTKLEKIQFIILKDKKENHFISRAIYTKIIS